MPLALRDCRECRKPFSPPHRRVLTDDQRNLCPTCRSGEQRAPLEKRMVDLLRKNIGRPFELESIADLLGFTDAERAELTGGGVVARAISGGSAVEQRHDGRVSLQRDLAPGGDHESTLRDRGDGWSVVGFTADNHLGSKHERLDVLNALYDRYAEEGVTDVYNAGNWIEGEARFNRHDLKVFGLDAQVRYFLDNYPARPGVTTHYVAGDDHEGWYVQRECFNIGQHVEERAHKAGRHDLHYLGYLEADVRLVSPDGGVSTPMRIMHGGGGSAYALSYVLQKTVESFQGGEKPSVLCLGHHHKATYCYVRNVHAFMPGCTEDQSTFMRKKHIEAHVGGALAWIKQDPSDGHITRFRYEFMPFYDRGYYRHNEFD